MLSLISQDTKLLVSLISGIVALTSAIIAAWQAFKTVKIESRTSLELEEIKSDNEKKKLALDETKRLIEPISNSIDITWKQLQITKDELKKYLAPGGYKHKFALEQIEIAQYQIATVYSEIGSQLDIEAKVQLHSSKNLLLSIVTKIEICYSKQTDFTPFAKEYIERITDLQFVLANARQQLIGQQFNQFVEMLK